MRSQHIGGAVAIMVYSATRHEDIFKEHGRFWREPSVQYDIRY